MRKSTGRPWNARYLLDTQHSIDQEPEYSQNEVDIYKVNTEVEQELSMAFGIQSIPSILFIPKEGQPKMQAGALPKSSFIQIIDKELLSKN